MAKEKTLSGKERTTASFSFISRELFLLIYCLWVSRVVLVVKNPPANARDIGEASLIPGLGRFPSRRAWQPTPVFLPGESHGLRSLAGYSPWRHKELDTTEQLSMHALPLTPTFWDHILDHSPLPSAKFWFQDSGLGELKPRHPFTAGCGLGL